MVKLKNIIQYELVSTGYYFSKTPQIDLNHTNGIIVKAHVSKKSI